MPEEELKEEQLRLQFRKCGGEGATSVTYCGPAGTHVDVSRRTQVTTENAKTYGRMRETARVRGPREPALHVWRGAVV